ncbi:reticulon-like protein of the endoplasmic reticulum [Lunasporangiospora selenospora]|uniref:Reticulon-like protein n=1 Tax=Lunasporangiospora selenospora TaxID=979761 RepID=A0A9P6KHA8_9FUNG|nr:reticulon-like protein of the endoplasmic reticulum [Lunasporangiospora selenospora]
MEPDRDTRDHLQADSQQELDQKPFVTESTHIGESTAPARERSGADSPKASHEGKSVYPHSYMAPKLRSLVLWENPKHSAVALTSSLTFIMLCRYYSLLNLTCALFVYGISAAFAYVNGSLLVSNATNKPAVRPLEKYYVGSTKSLLLDSRSLHQKVDYFTDGLNVILTELAKIVLIEENKRSLKFIGIFYGLWTLRTWFSTTTLLAAVVVSFFAMPRIYLDNQAVIDAHVAKTCDLVHEHTAKGCKMAETQWNSVYTRTETMLQEKGLLKKTEKSE